MATIRPFKAYRPKPEHAQEVAAKPYDVLNSEEARAEVKGHPLSFLHIGKPEVDLDPSIDLHDPQVYKKGRENLQKLIDDGVLVEDQQPCLYLYSQTMGEHTQYGLVGCAAVEEYWDDTIKKHEYTRKDKEEDRCEHVRVTNAHTGPIFLTYRDNEEVDGIVDQVKAQEPASDLVAADGIRHQCWVISDTDQIVKLMELFAGIPNLYVADGHHRSAAAGIVGRERAKANPNHKGDEEYNFFLAVYFPASQLKILDYNRVVKDLHGRDKEEFMLALSAEFGIEQSEKQVKPSKKGEFGLYIDKQWYKLTANDTLINNPDPVESLDVAILQNYVLDALLGIKDPRTDKRVDFVGGIRGLDELERRVDSGEMKLAISMFPTSIDELMSIADAGKIMPPKSTWFEPKLRDGLFVHFLD
ncbi:MAG: hypothetical protein CL946_13490 [Ectothiorhodospiraceae bacterium]|nr:hypothetical protein [Ectothiorhodospiraceae bacterium]